ncbi:MAG TPA: hypothetical protein VMF07_01435 [Solirubrobacteraceae bacterium]|nr:hypothetical protein [Solirubrobacteraceae bacterium]
MPEPSILDEHLAEIDRRLRTIQSGLVPVPDAESADEPADQTPAPEPQPVPEREPEPLRLVEPGEPGDSRRAGQLAELIEAHERLLELHRELLSQYAEVLERRAEESATVSVTAGPFSTAGTVRDFERALAALPGVSAVTVREYLGDDRVQIDVRLTG